MLFSRGFTRGKLVPLVFRVGTSADTIDRCVLASGAISFWAPPIKTGQIAKQCSVYSSVVYPVFVVRCVERGQLSQWEESILSNERMLTADLVVSSRGLPVIPCRNEFRVAEDGH